jgi:chromosome segregation ATPase
MEETLDNKNFEIEEIEDEFTLIYELYREIGQLIQDQRRDISFIEDHIQKVEEDLKEVEKEIILSEEIQKENLFQFSKNIMMSLGIGGGVMGIFSLFVYPQSILSCIFTGGMVGGFTGYFFSK